MTVITRFAPSPTGYLHIGGARTALFNYLFAKRHQGKFLLRIEDTDKERSTEDAKKAILTSLKWLDISWDGEVVYQSERHARHAEVAYQMVEKGAAYFCFTPQDEINELREKAMANKQHFIFHSKWRDASKESYPKDVKPVIRLKAPRSGQTIIKDQVQGDVLVQNDHLDDMVMLRSDGSPTYMLAVVVDDHDMGVTHIIRGDDHLTNAARQQLIYEALGWDIPVMAHVPLIHGPDGAKLSKRHGALGVDAYRDMGYLPDALCNYLLRLGWSHGDAEVISREQAISWFNLSSLGKSPARLDFDKMCHLNAQYLRSKSNTDLLEIVAEELSKARGAGISDESRRYILAGLDELKPRAQLLTELVNLARIYVVEDKITYSQEAREDISGADSSLINEIYNVLHSLEQFNKDSVQLCLKAIATDRNIKIGELMKPVRALVTGMTTSPSVFEIMAIIGKQHVLARLKSSDDKP